MRLIAISLVATAVAAGVTPGRAADQPDKYDPVAAFAETDLNGDGVIDHEEFHERIVEVFYSADANKDGFLDAVELKRLVFPDDFTADDKDKDGRVSLREFLRVRFRDFESADCDDAGVLSREEVIMIYERKKAR